MKKIKNNRTSLYSKFRNYLYGKKVEKCKKFNNFLFDIASKCVYKEQREELLKLDKEREEALKLKENIEENIEPLYEAMDKNRDYIESILVDLKAKDDTIEVLSNWISDFHYHYRKGDYHALEELFLKLDLDKNLEEK